MPPKPGRYMRFKRQINDSNIQRQYFWNVPEGNRPDFSDSYSHGEVIPISWNALNNSVYDLWITSWDYDIYPVALCLARSVNLAHDGALNLINPNPPSDFFVNKTRYVLRFKPPTSNGNYIPLDPEIASPGFFIFPAKSSKTTTTTSTSLPSPTSSDIQALEDIIKSSPASQSSSDSSHQTMSRGASAGLTIGLVLFVSFLVIFLVGAFHYHQRRKLSRPASSQQKQQLQIKTIALPEKPPIPKRRHKLAKWPRRILPLDKLRNLQRKKDRERAVSAGVGDDGKDDKRGVFVSVDLKSPGGVEEEELETPWKTSPELQGDEGWIVHELYGGGGGQRELLVGPVELPGDSRYVRTRRESDGG
ncbi:hypothetical protein QBC38DRAFT_66658 [Podospora fimiseda]|uniref:Uncharacterized protein n=1 Tax=Podospora fimiseda TaxID=252190 RepID=A0AAN7BGB3_9PEZI|nr:hypothetical protein QBC38DRAFT_66658 [Podospora fimiseda]